MLPPNRPATPARIVQKVGVSTQGLLERVPIRLIDGTEREALLKPQNLDKAAAKEPRRFATLARNQRLMRKGGGGVVEQALILDRMGR